MNAPCPLILFSAKHHSTSTDNIRACVNMSITCVVQILSARKMPSSTYFVIHWKEFKKVFVLRLYPDSTHVIKLALFYNNITNIKTTKRKHFLEILPLQSDQNPPGHRYPHLRNTALEYVLPFGGENTMLNDSMRVHSH